VDIDRPLVTGEVVALDAVDELETRVGAAGVCRQSGEQPVLVRSQIDDLTTEPHGVLLGVDLEPPTVEAEDRHQGDLRALRSAQDGPDPCHELARAERLDEIVVGAGEKAGDALVLAGLRGEHEDGDVRSAADLAADGLPRDVRQHEIEHDQRRSHALSEGQALGAAAGDEDGEAVLLKIGADHVLD
jgi:hypothetical protein